MVVSAGSGTGIACCKSSLQSSVELKRINSSFCLRKGVCNVTNSMSYVSGLYWLYLALCHLNYKVWFRSLENQVIKLPVLPYVTTCPTNRQFPPFSFIVRALPQKSFGQFRDFPNTFQWHHIWGEWAWGFCWFPWAWGSARLGDIVVVDI